MRNVARIQVSIIVLVHNHLDLTKACLQSIFDNTSYVKTPYEVIVVDNGSTDGTKEYLQSLDTVKYIRNEANEG